MRTNNLSDIDPFRPERGQIKHLGVHQPVVENDIRLLDAVNSAHRQQIACPWPRPNERDQSVAIGSKGL